LGLPAQNILAEPEKRDTAMAMFVGALYAHNLDPAAIVINGASDHVVADEAEFVRVMQAAIDVAATQSALIAVGITPTRPETGFGYIKVGSHIARTAQGSSVFTVESFTEKPNEATARAFISTGRYFWNANMYVWSAQILVDAFSKYQPAFVEAIRGLLNVGATAFHQALPSVYKQVPAISIDYAISEKADNLLLIPGDFGWNDVGDWKVVYELGSKDLSGNVVMSEGNDIKVLALHSRNNLVHSDSRLIGLVGVNDMIVIDTGEILLIVPKEKSQDVKKIVERLKEEGKQEYL
jgi:mannose-1-phosphate guanylyltransferase